MKIDTYLSLIRLIYRRPYSSAFRQTVRGRRIDPGQLHSSRFLDRQVDTLLADIWREAEGILPPAELERYRNRGSQANVFFAALMLASYRALRAFGLERDYAVELCGEAGWKIYAKPARPTKALAKLRSRDPQARLNFILRTYVRFPFTSAGPPGAGWPGYECQTRWEADAAYLTFTSCAPLNFVRRYIDEFGDDGELALFQRTWCTYDWPGVDLMLGRPGYHARPHALSYGDDRCDQVWSVTPRPAQLPLVQPREGAMAPAAAGPPLASGPSRAATGQARKEER